MNFRRFQGLSVFLILIVATLVLFYPIFFGKIPFNGNFLVSFYSPWRLESWDGYPTGVPSRAVSIDQLRQYFPLFEHTWRSFRSGEIPLWNPYNFSGTPHLANWESAVFYPLNSVFIFASVMNSWIIFKIASVVLPGFFTFFYLRALKLRFAPSLFGAAGFAFSSTLIIWGEEILPFTHSVIWLPLCLYGVEEFVKSKSKVFWLVAIFSTLFSILAGYFQAILYVFVFSFTYVLFRCNFFGSPKAFFKWFLGNKKLFFTLLSIFPLGILLGAIQLIPAFELYLLSPRRVVELTQVNLQFLLPTRQLVTLFAPDFFGHVSTQNWSFGGSGQYYEKMVYVGLVPTVFAFLAVVVRKEFRSIVTFFSLWFLITLVLIFDNPASRLIYIFNIPLISTAIPVRIVFISAFCISVLAAIGFSAWSDLSFSKIKRRLLISLSPFVVVYASLIIIIVFVRKWNLQFAGFRADWTITALRNLAVPIFVFLLLIFLMFLGSYFKKSYKMVVIFVFFLLFSHSMFFSWKYLTFSERRFLYPPHPLLTFIQEKGGIDRFWTMKGGILENNFASVYKINSIEGYDPLNILSYNQLLSLTSKPNGPVVSRSDAFVNRDLNESNIRLLSLMGVRYFVDSDDPTFSPEVVNYPPNLEKVWQGGSFTVYENRDALPRVFLASNYEGPPQVDSTNKTTSEIEEERRKLIPGKLLSADFDFSNVLILEKPSPISAQYGPGTAEIVSYKPQEVIVKTKSSEPKLLFISDNYYPGWKATVDGNEVTILRSNYTFRAVPLVGGEHIVRFYFDSTSFKLGLLISLSGLGALLVLTLRRNPLFG